ETMVAQLLATMVVVGSFFAATHMQHRVRGNSSKLANAPASVLYSLTDLSHLQRATVRDYQRRTSILFSAQRSISANWGLHCNRRRSTPIASNSATRSAIWPGV